MELKPRLYLDNAATSFPKPECVYQAMDDYNRRIGVAAGRGSSRLGAEVAGTIDRARRAVARILDATNPEQVVFTFNGTDSLNLILHGYLRDGDHVVTTQLEHNSVVRPLTELASRGIRTTTVPVGADGCVDVERFAAALEPTTRLAVCVHASNVSGLIQPVARISAICRERGVALLLDAAQTLGSVPFSVRELGVDFVAAPGHKGLLGPLGTGVVWIRPGLEREVRPLRQGGTGSRSEEPAQPENLPDKFESGNLNVPGLYGLAAGAEWVLERTVAELARHEGHLTQLLLAELRKVPGVRVLGPPDGARVGIVSFQIDGYDPRDAAAILDETFGIECRAGLHCAAAAHAAYGTLAAGGTVRFSVGPFVTAEDVSRAVHAVAEIAASV
jgi:cysteine desulfurase/selenocysteine lyase